MDSFFPKTRRPTSVGLPGSLKRPPVDSITPPKPAKIPNTPSTPKDARIGRPQQPPPVRRKLQAGARKDGRKRSTTIRELFQSVHQQHDEESTTEKKPQQQDEELATPILFTPSPRPLDFETTSNLISRSTTTANTTTSTPIATTDKVGQKIVSGPLKGLSTSLLDIIKAKEAAAAATSPEIERKRELLGIAPEIVRIVPTIFVASKKEVIPYDRVVDKCHKGLRSNYSSTTIIECLDLLDKVAPEWVTIVTISRGKFMRLNKDKYTKPQLLQAIQRYKKQST